MSYRLQIVCLIFLMLFSGLQLSGQNRKILDSLKTVVAAGPHDSDRVKALNEISIVYRQVSKLDTAAAYASKALDLALKCGHRRGEGKATYYIGIVYAMRSEFRKADSCYQKATAIFKDIGDAKSSSTVLIAFGALRQLQGDHDGALQLFLDALEIKRELKDSLTMAAALTNIGNVYNSLNRPKEALSYFQEAHRIHVRFNEVLRYCDDWTNMANMYRLVGKEDSALILITAAIRLADSLEHRDILPYSYGILASIFQKQNMIDSTVFYYNRGLEIADEIGDLYMVSNHCINLGGLYSKLGKAAEASAYLNRGLRVAVEIDAKEHIRDAHERLFQHYKKNNRLDSALTHYELYVAYRDSVIDVEKQKSILRNEIRIQHEKEEVLKKAEQDRLNALAAEEDKRQKLIIALVSVALALVLIFAVFLYNRFTVTRQQAAMIELQKNEVMSQRDRLEEQNTVIEEKNKNITDSINYAKRIQSALLTSDALLSRNLPAYFIFYNPKDIVSGDFYWASQTPSGKFLLLTGDCTGHGVPGAFMSLLNISLLNEIVNVRGYDEPAEILNVQRESLIRALNQEGSDEVSRDGMDCSLCSFDFQKRTLTIAGANNPVWIVRDGNLLELKTDKQPVGVHEGDVKPFTEQRMDLMKGDMIYTLTDGYADQFGGAKGKKFKYSRLKELLMANAGRTVDEQKAALEETFSQWKGRFQQIDDVLIIGIRVA
jgi:serine phosphatase RsbU (regulator of sigma subunit)/Tfp pilus assembly protein PilF